MPSLPFAPPSPTKSTPSSPSIVLSPATGIHDRSSEGYSSNPSPGPASTKQHLYKSSEDEAAAYRLRYARYLAATFSMSLEAALADADTQLGAMSRRSSGFSEAETLRES